LGLAEIPRYIFFDCVGQKLRVGAQFECVGFVFVVLPDAFQVVADDDLAVGEG